MRPGPTRVLMIFAIFCNPATNHEIHGARGPFGPISGLHNSIDDCSMQVPSQSFNFWMRTGLAGCRSDIQAVMGCSFCGSRSICCWSPHPEALFARHRVECNLSMRCCRLRFELARRLFLRCFAWTRSPSLTISRGFIIQDGLREIAVRPSCITTSFRYMPPRCAPSHPAHPKSSLDSILRLKQPTSSSTGAP